ncbi:undecaprenyldiphospho-muramoylpentapeptide beta-N-acetylglucosaminyltransferase [Nonomuraea typhae]|uniref:undecaprenyldiphospho-muramoylpentapeptide beta-N-acetylglucosaminyltransferase n=1 Tax=Nonomuraea typhae TaxID=2603600 RepID=UPI0012F90E2B|nr:undecaprenyldiphospho-muramoylpentapeptide beta-N-acetylglucosaminyltransferase [Nonomuraea typhae]
MRVVLAGGGTAGHIEPALALADTLRGIDPGIGITCMGTDQGLETRLVPARGYDLELVPAVPLPRSITPQLLAMPGRLAGAVNAAAAVLDRAKADVLVGFGGYVATPAYLAAKRRGVPIIVHEANPRPGLANRLGAKLTDHVFTGHPDCTLAKAAYIGTPLRREIVHLDRLSTGDRARSWFGLQTHRPTLLVFGGSRGAASINQAALAAAPALRAAGVQVLHVIGPRNTVEHEPPPGDPQYVLLPYVDRMDLAYAAADLVLCRSGALTCAELTAIGLPAAYVPLPHGNGEQRVNAVRIAEGGGGLLVDDAGLSSDWIVQNMLPILRDPERVAAMSEAALALGRKDADTTLARKVLEITR